MVGAGNPEIGFRSLPIAVLMNKYTLTDLLQTCPRMHHTVPSPPAPPPNPQLCQNSGISLFVHLRMLTPNLCEISLCKGISRRAHIASISEGMQNKTKRKNEPREIPGAPTIWFRCGAMCLFSAWSLSLSKWLVGKRFSLRRPFL